MNRSTTAKEALIAELIGDVADLIARVEALTPTMNGTRQALTDAARTVASSVEPFRAEIAEIAKESKTTLMGYIETRGYQVAGDIFHHQQFAMSESARTIFANEVAPTLRQLTQTLREVVDRFPNEVAPTLRQLTQTVREVVDRANRPWDAWLTHAATAVLSSAGSGWLVFHLLAR